MFDTYKVSKNKKLLILILVVCSLVCTIASNSRFSSSEWTDYLKNPQRTAYSSEPGPDMPAVLWELTTRGDFDAPPFIIDEKVLIFWKDNKYHTWESKIFLLDVLTGEILQEFGREGPFLTMVSPMNGQVLGISDGNVYDVDILSKEINLLAEIPQRGSRLYPITLRERIILPTIPVVCLSKSDHTVEWDLENAPDGSEYRVVNLAGNEFISGFIMTDNGVPCLWVVDSSAGTLKWISNPLPAALWIALGDDTFYCGGKYLWAFDSEGKELWAFVPEKRIVSNIVLGPNHLYCADEAEYVYKVDLEGNLIWKIKYETSPWYYETHLIGAKDILYCVANIEHEAGEIGSRITAFSIEDGSKLWDLELDPMNYVEASPAVANGILIMGTVGGKILALASDPDLFVKQGNRFRSDGYTNRAINSYKKAAELYEKKGNLSQHEEIQKKIANLESSSEPQQKSTPSHSNPPAAESSSQVPEWYLIFIAGVIIGILILYAWQKKK